MFQCFILSSAVFGVKNLLCITKQPKCLKITTAYGNSDSETLPVEGLYALFKW